MHWGRAHFFLLCFGFASLQEPVSDAQSQVNHRFDLVLEQKNGSSVKVLDPAHVFSQGDQIRFRLRSDINGFLYVLDRGTSGKFTQLFPRDDLKQSRQITANTDFLIPASGSGWFSIVNPPGYDTVYFLISPTDLGNALSNSADTPDSNAATGDLSDATPRCDDQLFKARGECLDAAAGVKPMQKGESLPAQLPRVATPKTRDFVVVKESKDTSVSSAQPFDEPAIYRFKIAHT